MLGIGGVRALRALGYKPTVWHINEGHAAFQILERMPRKSGTGHGLRRRPRTGGRRHRLHHPHPGARRPRHLRPAVDGNLFLPIRQAAQDRHGGIPGPGQQSRQRRRLQSNRPGAARLAVSQRRQPHPRRHRLADGRLYLARSPRRGKPGELRHQRRARTHLPRPGMDEPVRHAFRRRMAQPTLQ